MSDHRSEKIESVLVTLASKFFVIEAGPTSLITITKAEVNHSGKNAKIFFTVFPDKEEGAALDFAKRKRSEFRDFIKEHSRLALIPFIDFDIDLGEKNRQLIDRLSQNQ